VSVVWWFGVFNGQFGGNLEGIEGKLEAREAKAGERKPEGEGTGLANGIGHEEISSKRCDGMAELVPQTERAGSGGGRWSTTGWKLHLVHSWRRETRFIGTPGALLASTVNMDTARKTLQDARYWADD